MQSVSEMPQRQPAITWVHWDRVLVRIGEKRVVVKPALAVLAAAVLTASFVIPLVRHGARQRLPAYGIIHPQRWKFTARNDAAADITLYQKEPGKEVPLPAGRGIYLVDCDAGFTVTVERPGRTTDSVHLRNALNLDLLPNSGPIALRFEAATEGDSPGFPVYITVRDDKNLLWSKQVDIMGSRRMYRFTTPLKPSKNRNVTIAFHLGTQSGSVSIWNIRMAAQR
jgi:hypothetical protein